MHKKDNNDIWESLIPLVAERAKEETIRVAWAKGHATDEHIAEGKASQEEKSRNGEADKLATQGIANKRCGRHHGQSSPAKENGDGVTENEASKDVVEQARLSSPGPGRAATA